MADATAAPGRDALAVLHANTAALSRLQDDLAPQLDRVPDGYVACAGRDGSPTFRTVEGGWWRRCSVPRAASLAMLDQFTPSAAPVTLFLHPLHPAALTVALGKLPPEHALIALLDEPADLALFLACDNFVAAIESHRLLFASSLDHLASLLARHRSMPIPGTFIRTSHLPDATVSALIEACQKIFIGEQNQRTARVEALRASGQAGGKPGDSSGIVVSTLGRFALWHGHAESDTLERVAGEVLASGQGEVTRWNADDPLTASPLHLLELSRGARAMVLRDLFRPDLHDLLPRDVRLITWVTTGRLLPFDSAGPHDHLLFTDASDIAKAHQLGWPADRTHLAQRPLLSRPPATKPTGRLGFIADTSEPAFPETVEDYSSHKLLCERVQAELSENPLVTGPDILTYLARVRDQMHIDPGTFPLELVALRFAIPLWRRELARHVAEAGVPLAVYGTGWPVELNAEPVASRVDLVRSLASVDALIRPEPLARSHATESTGLTVLRLPPAGTAIGQFVAQARRALASRPAPEPLQSPLTATLLRRLLG